MFGGYWWLILIIPTILAVLRIFVGALYDEGADMFSRWWEPRRGLTDRKQSRSVRSCAQCLTARRRSLRLEAAELLGELGDRSAVPALLRAVELYPADVPFLMKIIHSLAQLGDARAIPVLRRLTANRCYVLMEAARDAIATIEPPSVLLRPSVEPQSQLATLLRPAHGAASTEKRLLLRSADEK